MDNRPIGIFDSGLGGLTVLRAIKKLMPEENLIYFGDSKRTPYGSKSKQTIIHFSFQDVAFLISKNVKAIVIACNTVSSNAVTELKEHFDIPIIEVINSGAMLSICRTKNKKVGVIGTQATIASGSYQTAIKNIDDSIAVYTKHCPLFVPLVEEGEHFWNCDITRDIIKYYLKELVETDIDTLVLGCTHYPLLMEAIDQVLDHKILLVNSADEVAKQTLLLLDKNNAKSNLKKGEITLYTSDSVDKFIPLAKDILQVENIVVEKIDIEKY